MVMGACVCYFVLLVVLRVKVESSACRSAANACLWTRNCRRQQTYISMNCSLSACYYHVVATCAGCPTHVTCAHRLATISEMKTRTAWEMHAVGAVPYQHYHP
jgi:hypothetical protein